MDRFSFGKNWNEFSERMQYEDYLAAKESLKNLLPDLQGKTFLDVGCGSGLFSIAAGALGAKKVLGFDYDPDSISVSKKLLRLFRNGMVTSGKVQSSLRSGPY